MRIVISDRAGVERIALRGIHFYARQYQAVGTLTSTKIDNLSLGFVQFMAAQEVTSELTNITHQISYDGVHFSGIAPGDQFDLGGKPFWYRAYLERLDSNFETKSAPLPTPGKDPAAADYYRLGTMSAIDLGNNILERTITLDLLSQTAISARILALREVPLPGTLNVYQGAALLGPQEYTFLNNALSFAGNDERLRLVIRYQTSVFANAGLVARREYYITHPGFSRSRLKWVVGSGLY